MDRRYGTGYLPLPKKGVREEWKRWSSGIRKRGWRFIKVWRNSFYPKILMASLYNDRGIEAEAF